MSLSQSFNRRTWLRLAALGVAGGTSSSWLRALAADAAAHPYRTKNVILLWLSGGPPTIDLWDLKPGSENGGPFKEIFTAVPGIRISEHLPQLARHMGEMAIVRSMTSKEDDHGRATSFVKTGYTPQASIRFPPLGALVAHELYRDELALPGFVSIAPDRTSRDIAGGFLGPRFAPLEIAVDPPGPAGVETAAALDALKVDNLSLPSDVTAAVQQDRLQLLAELDDRFKAKRSSAVVDALRSANGRAVRMMQSEAARVFDLEEEHEQLRDAYGRNLFGQGCLLARRLVERGVPFVEVNLDGWDTHQDNFERVRGLSQTLDAGFATLLADLKDRGLLESTLIICQGEFGRTPKINSGVGRDHWPQAWATALAGGGIRAGQTLGKTTADGMQVDELPVTIPDLVATVCHTLGINPRKQNISNVSRPIRIADPEATIIEGLV